MESLDNHIDKRLRELQHALIADLTPIQAFYDANYSVSDHDWEEANVIWCQQVAQRLDLIRLMVYQDIMSTQPNSFWTKNGLVSWVNKLICGEDRKPKVGLGVVIVKQSHVLLGTRIGSHCEGSRCVPGGHLEYGESIEDGSLREVEEETKLKVKLRRFDESRLDWMVVNNVLEGKHYVGIFVVADWIEGEPVLMEPNKNLGWEWVPYEDVIPLCKPGCAWLPTELFVNYRDRLLKVPDEH